MRKRTAAGFSLVELLAVMAIIAIIAAASISTFQGSTAAFNLSNAAQLITSEITTARQTALTYSETVEVRFYLYTDPITNATQYQAIQSFSTTDSVNFTQLDRISYFPVNIMIDQISGTSTTALSYPLVETAGSPPVSPTYTPNGLVNLIQNGATTTATSSGAPATIPGGGVAYSYKYLRFKPSGAIDYVIPLSGAPAGWPPASWYITLHEKRYYATVTTLAATPNIKNFITVSVDSTDGRVRTYQP